MAAWTLLCNWEHRESKLVQPDRSVWVPPAVSDLSVCVGNSVPSQAICLKHSEHWKMYTSSWRDIWLEALIHATWRSLTSAKKPEDRFSHLMAQLCRWNDETKVAKTHNVCDDTSCQTWLRMSDFCLFCSFLQSHSSSSLAKNKSSNWTMTRTPCERLMRSCCQWLLQGPRKLWEFWC